MTPKWNQVTTSAFLELYESYPCLWDVNRSDYKDKNIKQNAYEEIISQMGLNMTVDEIKNKVKSIRTAYHAELNKINKSKKTGTDADNVYVPTIIWFKIADRFLRNIVITLAKNRKMHCDNPSAKYVKKGKKADEVVQRKIPETCSSESQTVGSTNHGNICDRSSSNKKLDNALPKLHYIIDGRKSDPSKLMKLLTELPKAKRIDITGLNQQKEQQQQTSSPDCASVNSLQSSPQSSHLHHEHAGQEPESATNSCLNNEKQNSWDTSCNYNVHCSTAKRPNVNFPEKAVKRVKPTIILANRLSERRDGSMDDDDDDDEIDIFCRSIACHLRKLPVTVALEAMNQIQSLVIQRRLKYENSRSKLDHNYC